MKTAKECNVFTKQINVETLELNLIQLFETSN